MLVLALPRGGVPVAFEVARALDAPLDVFVVRKLGVPGHEELAMGAIASGGAVRCSTMTWSGRCHPGSGDRGRRRARARGAGAPGAGSIATTVPPLDVRGRTVILVDDGLATGSTMRAAVAALRRLGPARIVVAVPTAAPSTCDELGHEADECVCVHHARAVLRRRALVRGLLPDDRRRGPRPPRTGRRPDDGRRGTDS